VLIVVLIIGYFNFPLFKRVDTPMAEINLKGVVIKIKFVQSGATTQDVTQISMKRDNGDERVIKNITKMNFLVGYQILNDTSLELMLKDTVFPTNKVQTFNVILPRN
jgi:hypothetical protein